MPKYIPFPRVEGEASRQAHADLPDGTYERELSKEGFFGPAAHMYYRHPPTGWTAWEGPLRPRAFDLTKLPSRSDSDLRSPWNAPVLLTNASVRLSFWRLPASMNELARNGDGDQLLFVHQGSGDLFCDYGHLGYRAGDYLYLPRGTMWRLTLSEPTAILMIQATNTHFGLPDKGLLGGHALFDPAMLETPVMDEAFK